MMTGDKRFTIRLKPADEHALDVIKKHIGVVSDSEVIRYSLAYLRRVIERQVIPSEEHDGCAL